MRSRIYRVLQGWDSDPVSRLFGIALMGLIVLNVLAVILATEKALATRYGSLFAVFEVASIGIFSIEYALRLWACTADKRFRGRVSGRLRFAVAPLAIIDLLAILPFYLPMLVPVDLRFVRVLRLMRVFRLLKAARYSTAPAVLWEVLREKREELIVALTAVLVLLVFSASVMYHVEHEVQPKTFGSIPAAMWWGVVTLTTVGYGDVYPVTPVGKCCAAVIALLSIGLFALPAGILAAGFAEVLQKSRGTGRTCPHCGRRIEE